MKWICVPPCLLMTGMVWIGVNQSSWAKAVEWMAQIEAPLVQITGVQLNVTEIGFEVIFDSSAGQLETPSVTTVGNALIADIPNAFLNLPKGDEFQSANPVEGIAWVTVSSLSDNRVRIAITGLDAPPTAEFRKDAQALIVSVSTVALENTEPTEIDENRILILVTAEKTPDDVQDVPISLTVLTEQQLQDAQIDSLAGISQNAPNFFFIPSSPGNFSSYTIRGLGNNNFRARDAVGFFINDVPYDSGLFFDTLLTDLERVEVLRGPQNTLYGRSSSAGVVNIITRPPTDELEIRSAVSYGNENFANLQLSISDTILPETLGFRVAGAYNRQDGLVDNVFLDEDVGDRSEGTGLAELRWTPSNDWTVSLTGTFRSSDNDGFTNQIEPFITDQDEIGFVRLNSNSQALKVTYDHENFQLNSTTTRRFTNFERQLDADATSADLVLFPLEEETRILSQEIRFQAPEDADQLRWLLGGYYEARDFKSEGGFDFTDLGAVLLDLESPGLDLTISDLEQDTFAVFGQIDYQPIEPLTLTAGLRYETNTARLERDRRFELPGGDSRSTGLNVDGEEQESSAVLPRFALEFRFSPNVVTYASITRGYRPGGLNTDTDFQEALEFEEETSWSYELGIKTAWLDNRIRGNLAIFTNQVDNYQTLLFDDSFFSSTISNAEVSITGFEIEVNATPTEGLDLAAGFGYLDDRFTDFTNPLTGEDSSGNRLPFTPRFNYNLAVQYRTLEGFLGRLELQGFGAYFFDEANQFKQDPFALVNVRMGFESEQYGIYGFVNNLFDNEYLVEQFAGLGNVLSSFGDRRTFGVQVRASF